MLDFQGDVWGPMAAWLTRSLTDGLGIGLGLAAGLGLAWAWVKLSRRDADQPYDPLATISQNTDRRPRRLADTALGAITQDGGHEHDIIQDEDEDDDGAGGSKKRRRKAEEEARQKRSEALIDQIEASHGSRVISIVHRETTENFFLSLNDLEDVLTALQNTGPNQPLDIILHTRGGLSLAGMQISRALKAHKGKKTAYVPYYAMSAGTLIALGCDEVVMAPHACLGPIDPQYGLPAVSIAKVADLKPVETISDDFLVFVDMSKKALAEAREHACELMQGTYSHDGSCMISDALVSGRWTHGNPITATAAQELGLKVRLGVPQAVTDLVRVYRIPTRRGASVAYRT